jgi:hypothetical protein
MNPEARRYRLGTFTLAQHGQRAVLAVTRLTDVNLLSRPLTLNGGDNPFGHRVGVGGR